MVGFRVGKARLFGFGRPPSPLAVLRRLERPFAMARELGVAAALVKAVLLEREELARDGGDRLLLLLAPRADETCQRVQVARQRILGLVVEPQHAMERGSLEERQMLGRRGVVADMVLEVAHQVGCSVPRPGRPGASGRSDAARPRLEVLRGARDLPAMRSSFMPGG